MNFEIHLTLEVNLLNINKFTSDCKKFGVKPIFIQTENSSKEFGNQIMTSSKYTDVDYKEKLNELISLFETNYKILRKKVEIQPEKTKHTDHIYYESHLRLKLPKNYNTDTIKKLCIKNNFHLSKNLFKIDNDFDYQTITYRDYKINYITFQFIINKMADNLNKLNIECDKIEIEECIYDSSINIDNNWLNKNKMIIKNEERLVMIANSIKLFLNKYDLLINQSNIFNALHDENIIYNENLNSNDIITIENLLLNNS